MRKTIIAIALAFTLAGCAGADKSVFQGGTNILLPVQNVVTNEHIAGVLGAYGAVLVALNAYRSLPLCKAGQTESILRLCARRDVVVMLQGYNKKARLAVTTLVNFRKNYPNLNAIDALNAARSAVADFRSQAVSAGLQVQ